jgi:hypothetical protein
VISTERTLGREQCRVLGHLHSLCGERARLHDVLKSQDVSPETVCGLAERGLIVAKLDGEGIDLTPGLIKTHRRDIHVRLSKTGESCYWNSPRRVLGSLGRAKHGLSLSYLLGMILFDDVVELHREGLLDAVTETAAVDLGNARQPWPGSTKLALPGGEEVWISSVRVRATATGRLYSHR